MNHDATAELGQPFAGCHDHDRCVDDALNAAQSLCHERGERLTPLRRRVLELLWQSHKPIGAYDLLDMLRQERSGVAPPTVYRSLDFLHQQGLIHRIESLNAFIGCPHAGNRHQPYFLICRSCGTAAEITDPTLKDAFRQVAEQADFLLEHEIIELRGICAQCRSTQDRTTGSGSDLTGGQDRSDKDGNRAA